MMVARTFQFAVLAIAFYVALIDGLRFPAQPKSIANGGVQSRSRNMACKEGLLDSRELTKIFGRFAAKTILLDIPGAGTPEMASCCHGGCDNCNYSHSFDSLSAGRGKWVPTYSTRTLIDGRYEKAPWASIFDSEGNPDEVASLSKETFTERLQQLPYNLTMGPGTSVPADEMPVEGAVSSFYDMLVAALVASGEEVAADSLNADQVITTHYIHTITDLSLLRLSKAHYHLSNPLMNNLDGESTCKTYWSATRSNVDGLQEAIQWELEISHSASLIVQSRLQQQSL